MSNADFIGEAKVLIVPDVSNFERDLKTRLEKVLNKQFKVNLEPTLVGFEKKLRDQLKTVKAPTVSINVEIDPVSIAEVKAQIESLSATIPVQTVTTAGGAAGGGGGARIRSAQQIAAENLRAEEITQAEMNRIHAQALDANERFNKQITKQNVSGSKQRIQTAEDEAKATSKRFGEIDKARKALLERAQVAAFPLIEPVQTEALTANKQFNDLLAAERKAKDALLAVDTASVGVRNKAVATRATEAAATKAVVAATEFEVLANKAESDVLATQIALFRENAAAAVLDAEAKLDLAAADAAASTAAKTHGTQIDRLSRGAGSSALTFAGLRGATLAASSEFIAGAAAVLAFSKALGAAVNLEEQLNVFQATAGATAAEMETVAAEARRLGADIRLPTVSAGDAAQAMAELAKAGLSVENAIAGARGVLQLATAAQISNAAAAQLAANALNSFGLAGEQASHVADLLANAANAAQGSIQDFGDAFAQSSAVARSAGVSLEDTTAILTQFARNGLRGSDAGTSLRTALIRITAPSKEARAEIERLGLRIRDVNGNVRPDIFVQFGEATKDLAPSVRDAAAALIFGQDAIRAASIGAREGAEGLESARQAMDEVGSAARLAEARTKGLGGAMRGLTSSLETFGETGAGIVLPFLTSLVERLAETIAFATEAANRIKSVFDALPRDSGGRTASDALTAGFGAAKEEVDALFTLLGRGKFVEFGKSASQTLKDLDGDAEQLAETLAETQQQRARLLALGLPTENIDRAIIELQTKLDNLAQGIRPDQIQLTPLEIALKTMNDLIEQARDQGLPASDFVRQAEEIRHAIELTQGPIGRLAREGIDIPPPTGAVNRIKVLLSDIESSAASLNLEGEVGDAARSAVTAAIAELAQLGPKGAAALRASGATLAPALSDALRATVGDFTGLDLTTPVLPDAVRSQIRQIAQLGPAGKAQLRLLGKDLSDALADGIKESSAPIEAAREQVREAIRQSQEALRDSITDARENLRSLGDQISRDLAEAIDAGPIGRRIEGLSAQLDALRDKVTQRQVDRGVRDAQRELDEARASIVTLGQITPDQQKVIDEFLRPFVEKLQDAKDEAKAFKLETAIKAQEDLRDSAKEAATKGIERLVDDFEDGRITAEKFASAIKQKLGASIKDLPKTNLGMRFSNTFLQNMQLIVDQARELVGFLGVPGTAPGGRVVSPAQTRAEQAESVAQARKRLQDAIDAQKDTADNTKAMKLVLDDILAALKPPKTPPKQGQKPKATAATPRQPDIP